MFLWATRYRDINYFWPGVKRAQHITADCELCLKPKTVKNVLEFKNGTGPLLFVTTGVLGHTEIILVFVASRHAVPKRQGESYLQKK